MSWKKFKKTRNSLPAVMIGLHPRAGGRIVINRAIMGKLKSSRIDLLVNKEAREILIKPNENGDYSCTTANIAASSIVKMLDLKVGKRFCKETKEGFVFSFDDLEIGEA